MVGRERGREYEREGEIEVKEVGRIGWKEGGAVDREI